jgi:hypothetical protein
MINRTLYWSLLFILSGVDAIFSIWKFTHELQFLEYRGVNIYHIWSVRVDVDQQLTS